MIAARSGRTDITNILLEGEHIDLDIQENVSVLLQAPNTLIDVFSHKSYCLHRLEDGQLSTSLLRMETQLPHMLSSKQELMSTSKTRSGIAINSLSFKLCSLSLYRIGGQLWRLLKSSQQMKRLQSYLSGLMSTCVVAIKE